jgi:hypothetical protein
MRRVMHQHLTMLDSSRAFSGLDSSRAFSAHSAGSIQARHSARSVASTHHENVAGGGKLASDAKELEQVVELAVNVSANGDGRGDGLDIALLVQQLLHHLTQLLHVLLWQVLAPLYTFQPFLWACRGLCDMGLAGTPTAERTSATHPVSLCVCVLSRK